MNWPPEIGTRVVISEEGHSRYGKGQYNPKGVEGTVMYTCSNITGVNWDTGTKNTYEEFTLELPIYQLEND